MKKCPFARCSGLFLIKGPDSWRPKQGSRQLEQPRISFSLKSGSPKHGANEVRSGPGPGKARLMQSLEIAGFCPIGIGSP
jgi:hypothetical protein